MGRQERKKLGDEKTEIRRKRPVERFLLYVCNKTNVRFSHATTANIKFLPFVIYFYQNNALEVNY